LSNVEVRLFHTDKTPLIHTNARGEFAFHDITPGRYFLQTTKRGYRAATSQQFWISRLSRTTVTIRQLKVGMMFVCE
jgi:Carboxypeptidase regulatory-like domain